MSNHSSTGKTGSLPESGTASSGTGSSPSSTDASGTGACEGSLTIISETIFDSPANRKRKRIAVGEEVDLSVDSCTAEWSITSGKGSLEPSSGSNKSVTFTAGDSKGTVTITAVRGTCRSTITFTVVEPSHWTMKKKDGTNIRHQHGRPDCGWIGVLYLHPDDVNFCNAELREKDSSYVGNGVYKGASGDKHGNYAAPDCASEWAPFIDHSETDGTLLGADDTIDTGDPGAVVTGTKVPFKTGSGYFSIIMQWRVRSGKPKELPASRQEDEILADGRCKSRKGNHTESTLYTDATSSF